MNDRITRCEGGVEIGAGPCVVCGRTSKESCGRPPADARLARIGELESALAAERARAERAEAALRELGKHPEECDDESGACVSHLAYEDVKADRDRLRAAGRALLACPHIAERDTDPDWVDAETEAAVAEMRAALKET